MLERVLMIGRKKKVSFLEERGILMIGLVYKVAMLFAMCFAVFFGFRPLFYLPGIYAYLFSSGYAHVANTCLYTGSIIMGIGLAG